VHRAVLVGRAVGAKRQLRDEAVDVDGAVRT